MSLDLKRERNALFLRKKGYSDVLYEKKKSTLPRENYCVSSKNNMEQGKKTTKTNISIFG